MNPLTLIAAFVLLVSPAIAQQTGAATTKGTCSPATTGNNNTFTFNCGIGKEQGQAILGIVNRILANQIDPAAVMAKLDDIQRGVDQIRDQAAPRVINDQNATAVTKLLSQFPKQTIRLSFLSANEESRRLAERIRSIVIAAGWECEPPSPMMPFATGPLPGIQINAKEATKAATGFLNALGQLGLGVQGNLVPALEANIITVQVYGKP